MAEEGSAQLEVTAVVDRSDPSSRVRLGHQRGVLLIEQGKNQSRRAMGIGYFATSPDRYFHAVTISVEDLSVFVDDLRKVAQFFFRRAVRLKPLALNRKS